MRNSETLTQEIIDLILSALNLHHIDKSTLSRDTELVQGGLELDSVDILELIVSIEQRYKLKIRNEEVGKQAFRSIGTLVDFIQKQPATS